jgi:hypothetical protein
MKGTGLRLVPFTFFEGRGKEREYRGRETAGPSTALRSGRDDKGAIIFRKGGDLDRRMRAATPKTADPSTALLRSSGRDDKDRTITFRKGGDLDGRS